MNFIMKPNFNDIKNLYVRLSPTPLIDFVDLSQFENIETIKECISHTFDLQNKHNLNFCQISTLSGKKVVIKNNNNLSNLRYSEYAGFNFNIPEFEITNNPAITSINLQYSKESVDLTYPSLIHASIYTPNAKNINFSSFSQIKRLRMTNANSLTSWNYLPATIDSSHNLTDFLLSAFDQSLVDDNFFVKNSYLDYRENTNNNFFYRTSASDTTYLNLLKKTVVTPFEVDAKYPTPISPSSYVSSSWDSYTLYSPISTSGTTAVRFNALSGNYIKTGLVNDNRDVFSNSNDYHILFNKLLSAWTVVGPTSASNTIWLSAGQGIGDWGNPPSGSVAWKGAASNISQANSNAVWWQATCIAPSNQMLFNAVSMRSENGGTVLRYCYNPLSGYNVNFFKPELDFSGILHVQDSEQPGASTRGYMISPYHYFGSTHFGKPTLWSKYGKDGTVQKATMLSAVDVGSDTYVAILNQPLSGTYYKAGIGNFHAKITTKNDLNNFLFGPTQNGRVGCTFILPSEPNESSYIDEELNIITSSSLQGVVLNQEQVYSIPKSTWHGDHIVLGDSSTQFWHVTENNELIMLGHISGAGVGGGSGQRYGFPALVQTINHTMSALQSQFHPSETLVYHLSTYNFDV